MSNASSGIDSAFSEHNASSEFTLLQRNLGLDAEAEQRLQFLLNSLPTAIYTTDILGRITFYNKAAAALWGCEPTLNSDQWCGSWRLYWPDGTPLPHDECPMAIALKEMRSINGQEAVAERPDGTRVPFMAFPSPVRDSRGRVVGAVNMLVDISERKRAEEALRENEERFRALVDASAQIVWTADADGIVVDDSPSWRAFTGQTFDQGSGIGWADAIHPEDRERVAQMWRAVVTARARLSMEYRLRRFDGEWRWTAVRAVPLTNGDGSVRGWVGMNQDITEIKRAEVLSRRLAAIVESSDDAIVSKSLDGIIATWNKGAERLFGYRPEEVIGRPILILIPEDRHDEEPSIMEHIRRGERVEHYETVRRRKDGSLVEISLTVSPVRDDRGEVVGASKIARDITERKRAQERLSLLAREVDHRAKNLLAVVQATVNLAQADTPKGVKQAIGGRLQALANVHTLFSQSAWVGADLRTLVMQELAPFREGDQSHAEIRGPELMLQPDTAQSMAVALHELATNAAKYGALSVCGGRVRVEWSHEPNGHFFFRWTENGGPPVEPPRQKGFGTRVIEQMMRGQKAGRVRFDWRREGLVCELAMDGINPPAE